MEECALPGAQLVHLRCQVIHAWHPPSKGKGGSGESRVSYHEYHVQGERRPAHGEGCAEVWAWVG